MSSINRVLRNLASKSFDSVSSTSSSSGGISNSATGGGGGSGTACQEANVYDKLRLLNNGQPWSTHASAWYVPSSAAAAAAAVNAAFSQHLNGQNSPSPYNNMSHLDLLNENQGNQHHHLLNSSDIKLDLNGNECKKGWFKISKDLHLTLIIQLYFLKDKKI